LWITADVEIPERLLDAQRDSRLVVFAGAGISIDAPSGMPSFAGLVQAMAAEAGEEVPEWGTVSSDAFLGRLAKDHFRVHKRASALLTPTTPQSPNDYHAALLQLFREPESVRIVTTNHDPFLTIAGRDVFGDAIESYYAPALPVGDDFSGIVYLHGGIARDSSRLVLTDADFGRAYLTQAWATIFLRAMYSRFDVLFIGYSHGEPVLRYLASGLSSNAHRYAFDTSDSDGATWLSIGVTRIPYPRSNGSDEHVALRQAVLAWSERARMGYLEHEAMIRDNVRGLPPLDVVAGDYLRQIIGDPATAKFFGSFASAPEWLGWARDLPQFRSLFGQGELPPGSLELAEWFARMFVLGHPEVALSVLQEMGGRMRPELWFACASQLWQANPRPDPQVFAKWTTALIESTPALGADRFLGYLLDGCRWPEDASIALLLFAHLTDPHPEFDQRLAFLSGPGRRVTVSIGIRGDSDQLSESWLAFFKPRLNELAEQLEPIVSGQLVRAHEILKATGGADDRWDPTSMFLPRIEGKSDA
jgi:hypothetical protein